MNPLSKLGSWLSQSNKQAESDAWNCCTRPQQMGEMTDMGHANSFELDLASCGTCGAYWASLFCVANGMERAQYVFILSLIFVLPLASFVVMPISVGLARVGAATVALMAAAGVMSALALGALKAAYPSNEWGRAHRFEAFIDTTLTVGAIATVVFCAFALGARMPLWRFPPRPPRGSETA